MLNVNCTLYVYSIVLFLESSLELAWFQNVLSSKNGLKLNVGVSVYVLHSLSI